jgi:hypothetical protein
MGAAGVMLAMLATVAPAAFVASGQPQTPLQPKLEPPCRAAAADQRCAGVCFCGLHQVRSAGGQNHWAIGGDGYGVLGVCAS